MRELVAEKAGKNDYYVIRTELLTGDDAMGGEPLEMTSGYTLDGHYIGNEKTTLQICVSRGIKPELKSKDYTVCSIGFCANEDKWYGWSHRAMYGFGVGSEVKRGDCGYIPVDMDDARQQAINFWSDEDNYDVTATDTIDSDGRFCFYVSWTYTEGVTNPKLRGTSSGIHHYPDGPGKGEWTAKSIEDAKEMAIDFANSIA